MHTDNMYELTTVVLIRISKYRDTLMYSYPHTYSTRETHTHSLHNQEVTYTYPHGHRGHLILHANTTTPYYSQMVSVS